jgi:hypothetical protein
MTVRSYMKGLGFASGIEPDFGFLTYLVRSHMVAKVSPQEYGYLGSFEAVLIIDRRNGLSTNTTNLVQTSMLYDNTERTPLQTLLVGPFLPLGPERQVIRLDPR